MVQCLSWWSGLWLQYSNSDQTATPEFDPQIPEQFAEERGAYCWKFVAGLSTLLEPH